MSKSIQAAQRRLREDRKHLEMESSASASTKGNNAAQVQEEEEPESDVKRYLKALLVLGVSVYGLVEAKLLENLLWSRKVNSPALALAVAASSLVVLLWAYLDVYVGALQGRKVHYEDTRTTTHVILLSMLVTGIALNVAIWPVYHAASLVLVTMLSYGVLFQFLILFPSWVYNPLLFSLYAIFVYLWTR